MLSLVHCSSPLAEFITMMRNRHIVLVAIAAVFLAGIVRADDDVKDEVKKPPQSYFVPYRISDVKHVVVRVKVNGQGPFNFIVDTGAPAVYFGSEMAKKLSLTPKEEGFWKDFDNVEIEGGLKLSKLKVRVEEPFQLVGINKMNAAGIKYHGVMGYSVLAQYKIEYDFTQPHLKWTLLEWKVPPPAVMGSLSAGASANMKAMIGLSSFATALMPKKIDPTLVYRGLVGIELAEKDGKLVITKVLPNTPAALAELKEEDQITSCNEKPVKTTNDLQKVLGNVSSEQEVSLDISRDGKEKTIKLTTARGF
jgi:membrane-associated protease RseP (regulator of RpoE activity)